MDFKKKKKKRSEREKKELVFRDALCPNIFLVYRATSGSLSPLSSLLLVVWAFSFPLNGAPFIGDWHFRGERVSRCQNKLGVGQNFAFQAI